MVKVGCLPRIAVATATKTYGNNHFAAKANQDALGVAWEGLESPNMHVYMQHAVPVTTEVQVDLLYVTCQTKPIGGDLDVW